MCNAATGNRALATADANRIGRNKAAFVRFTIILHFLRRRFGGFGPAVVRLQTIR